MIKLPHWMRSTMLATAVMNLCGAVAFIPAARALRELGGLPTETHPLYLTTVGAFIFIFGCAYLWAAIAGKADPLFVAVGAAGKLAFFGLLMAYSIAGLLPAFAVLSGAGDLVFGLLFLKWLFARARGSLIKRKIRERNAKRKTSPSIELPPWFRGAD